LPDSLQKLRGFVRTANDELFSRSVRHAFYIQQYASHETKRILDFLNDEVYERVFEKAQRAIRRGGLGRDLRTNNRSVVLAQQIDKIVKVGHSEALRKSRDGLVSAARAEAGWTLAGINKAMPIDWDTTLPSPATLRRLVTGRPFQGKFLREWWGGQSRVTRDAYKSALTTGLASGETIGQITYRVRKVTGQAKHQVEAIIGNAVNHVSSHTREETYRANSDIVSSVMMVATLDLKTSKECIAQDGKVYPIGKGPRPPFHMGRCRTTTVPQLKSWKELGINLKEAPPGTRASMNGQVPANLRYEDWLRDQSIADQERVLGKQLSAHWRAGRVKTPDLVDRRGIGRTLKEIEKDLDL